LPASGPSVSDEEAASSDPPPTEETHAYGLEILHEPKPRPTKLVQIIFVHGLGGSKRGTWTDSNGNFWPAWLCEEKRLQNVRIAVFGYNSGYNVLKANTSLSISHFATQLLAGMEEMSNRNGSVR